jgi:hypothetical protein
MNDKATRDGVQFLGTLWSKWGGLGEFLVGYMNVQLGIMQFAHFGESLVNLLLDHSLV